MRAVTIDKFGDTKVLNVTVIPQPEISSNEVLINIFATSVNPADCKMRQGFYPIDESFEFPYILGRDFSGQIEACGKKVTDFKMKPYKNGYSIKEPVFSFDKFPNVNKELGPEMKSTGESIYFIDDLMDDYFLDIYSKSNLYLSK